ncbi:MAG: hypothetical protein ACRDC6_09715 [Shewanella sp.]|uniref:hypothetical protein n=1 Tax=Plesiomonas shigelloides TaxID=703 RepID=UPI001261FC79|nr:hypothetical protein [Plesiomonas shigelloides]KAB7653192.1 hypothetical protein GBN14_15270 [Plesiomonas shigelloides]
MAEMIDWRKLPVRRDCKFESLEELLCSTKGGAGDKKTFNTIKELMVFAALVGYQLDKYEPITAKAKTTPILMDTYATSNHDEFIYLIALAKQPTLDILKDENIRNAINIFECYCNGGLNHIDNWIISNIGEQNKVNILFNKTLDFLIECEQV